MFFPAKDGIRDDGGNSTIEVENKEKGQDATDNQVEEKEPVEACMLAQGLRCKPVACHVRSAALRTIMMRLRETFSQGKARLWENLLQFHMSRK